MILSASLFSAAGNAEIRKIVHPDGRIEYTNLTSTPSPATHSETIYKFRNREGVLSFSNSKPLDILHYEVLRFDCFACRNRSDVDWHSTPLNLSSFRDATARAARQTQLDEALIRAIIHAESAFNPAARSDQGAHGLMQLMPETARYLGVANSGDPLENINGGSRYLAEMLTIFDQNEKLATAAYNAGPGSVQRYQGIPPYTETQNYVERVQILRRRYAEALN